MLSVLFDTEIQKITTKNYIFDPIYTNFTKLHNVNQLTLVNINKNTKHVKKEMYVVIHIWYYLLEEF
jgi:hypothetical protein